MAEGNKEMNKSRMIAAWITLIIVAISILIVPEYLTLTRENRIKAYQASDILIAEIEHIIASNNEDKTNLREFLMDTYLNKAKTISYVIDARPFLEEDTDNVLELAKMMGVDEIHIFDEYGTLYSGTDPDCYGLTLDSGEQMSYFKPMLQDHSLSMIQNIRPNTAKGKRALYFMCWNDGGTRMIEVGVNEIHFPRVLNISKIETFIARIPENQGTDIILTQKDNDVIVSATSEAMIGKTLGEIGIDLSGQVYEEHLNFVTGFPDDPLYCTVQNYNDYRIVITQSKKAVDENVPITLVTFTEYLILVFIAMSFVLDYVYNKFLQAQTCALKDKLTDLYNRREYENTLEEYRKNPIESNMIFVSMDVNGLKLVNDRLGHTSGDRLLKGAAECIQQCFGPYGKTFRYGGDEFVAIIYTDDSTFNQIQKQFAQKLQDWSRINELHLELAIGPAKRWEHPQADIDELAQIADEIMYRVKSQYYSQENQSRRGLDYEV